MAGGDSIFRIVADPYRVEFHVREMRDETGIRNHLPRRIDASAIGAIRDCGHGLPLALGRFSQATRSAVCAGVFGVPHPLTPVEEILLADCVDRPSIVANSQQRLSVLRNDQRTRACGAPLIAAALDEGGSASIALANATTWSGVRP
jgi:hypothetical protein